ncbi:cytochrome P450 family protein [Microbispora triticiradicis]|uniref:cytochrome P450 family protein n=1 Tax=Microbispora triticiradicis TaxID=2200763 RepID=UPI001AD7B1B8|nr:cytochrome P450 [Microbispora triticiradicis]MBO4274893.1 cytochrome P450 [Microbispora triticiradicis]
MTDTLPEIDLSRPEVLRDPLKAYGQARESGPLARLLIPGFGTTYALTRHDGARAMLGDPRFELDATSYMRPEVPEDCLPYMRTMSEMNGAEHARLRKLVAPAFTPRRAADFRPRIAAIVDALLDELPAHADGGQTDLLPHFARPLPMDVICALVGIPEEDRPRWREYGATVAGAAGADFARAIPGIMAGAKAAVAARRDHPDAAGAGGDLVGDLVRVQAEDGDRLSDPEIVTLVWHLVIAGQTPTNLIANAVAALLSHPDQLAALRADPALMPRAVEELTRWCGPAQLAVPRQARGDVELYGTTVPHGAKVTALISAANRDPRAFDDPDRLDLTRAPATGHLGFSHGPHFCLGASIARVQTQVALTALLRRFPRMALAAPVEELQAVDPGTRRLTALPVTL